MSCYNIDMRNKIIVFEITATDFPVIDAVKSDEILTQPEAGHGFNLTNWIQQRNCGGCQRKNRRPQLRVARRPGTRDHRQMNCPQKIKYFLLSD
ncbi:hypothetical protein OBV_17730 [Oscillibacter valericigenes Sjm18-20]|nr:hypothetical protein OBV_17730 [Oscillibacter valericigenes Sjm18-20]